MLELLKKYKHIILYLLFGVLTTLVNVVVYWICSHIIALSTMTSTIIAWILAVLFAYLTNRKLVFDSDAASKQDVIKECLSFFLARLATGVVDWMCMFIFVDVLMLNEIDMIIKLAANILVIILNYVASKMIVFRKKENNE